MLNDKICKFKSILVSITLVMLFTTLGLFMVTTQTKTINLEYYDNDITVKTLASNVQDFLLENDIVVSEDSSVYPSLDSYIENNSTIRISSNKELASIDIESKLKDNVPMVAKVEEVIEVIPFTEETRPNSSEKRGTTNVVEEGKDGQKSIKYLVKYDGNKEIERAKINTEVLKEAENKIIEVGTKLPDLASRSNLVESMANIIPTAADGFVAYNIALPVEQQQYAYNICKKYGIEYELLLAVMYKESRFNPNATGSNAYGLCQIHGSNLSMLSYRLGISSLYDPYDNMTAGAYLLSTYFGVAQNYVSGENVEIYALNAYNMGEGAYYTSCFSRGVLNREYSNSVIAIKNIIKTNGGI